METDKLWRRFQLSTRKGLALPRISLVSLTHILTEVVAMQIMVVIIIITIIMVMDTTIWISHTIMIIDIIIMHGPTQLQIKAPKALTTWWTMTRATQRVRGWDACAICRHLQERNLLTTTWVELQALIITTLEGIQERHSQRTQLREEHSLIIQMTTIQGKCPVLRKLLVAASDQAIIRTRTNPWPSRTTTCQCISLVYQTKDLWSKEVYLQTMPQIAVSTQ